MSVLGDVIALEAAFVDMLDKAALRREYIEKRRRMGSEEVVASSRAIWDKLIVMPEFISSERIMFYVSFNNEVDTHDMIREVLSMGKRVYVPKSLTAERMIIPIEISDFDRDLAPGAYGIPEPYPYKEYPDDVEEESNSPAGISSGRRGAFFDIIFVPGVLFDLEGNRIGYGGGYYDRFLSGDSGVSSLKIGLAFDWQLVNSISPEACDVPVDAVITDKRDVWLIERG